MYRAAMMVVAENQESDTVLSATDPFRQRQLYASFTPDELREVQALLRGLAQAVRRTISERASSQARRPGAVE